MGDIYCTLLQREDLEMSGTRKDVECRSVIVDCHATHFT